MNSRPGVLGCRVSVFLFFFPDTLHLKPKTLLGSLRKVDSLRYLNDHQGNIILMFKAGSEAI